MKVYLKTSLTPEMMLYDSKEPVSSSGFVMDLLSPVVFVADDDGKILYTYGEYTASNAASYVILAVIIGAVFWFTRKR